MVAQSAEFKKAVEDSRSLTQTPTSDELLEVNNQENRTTPYMADSLVNYTDLWPLQAGLRREPRRRAQARHVRP
jgi:hypothetical protein